MLYSLNFVGYECFFFIYYFMPLSSGWNLISPKIPLFINITLYLVRSLNSLNIVEQTTATSTNFFSPPVIQRTPLLDRKLSYLVSYGLVGNKWHLVNENDSFYYNTQYTSNLNALYFGTRASRKLSSEQQKLVKQKVTGLNLSVVDWKIWYSEQEPPQPRQEYNSSMFLLREVEGN